MRKPDFNDLLIATGLILAGVGLWMLTPWVSLAVVGAALVTLGMIGSSR